MYKYKRLEDRAEGGEQPRHWENYNNEEEERRGEEGKYLVSKLKLCWAVVLGMVWRGLDGQCYMAPKSSSIYFFWIKKNVPNYFA